MSQLAPPLRHRIGLALRWVGVAALTLTLVPFGSTPAQALDLSLPSLASVNAAGNGPGNNMSTGTWLSSNGRYLAFESIASNLTSHTDTNGKTDVFVRDLLTGTTELISVNSAGTGTGNAWAFITDFSPDGRYVVMHSDSGNLSSVTDLNGTYDVYVRDRQLGTTTLVSIDSTGSFAGNTGGGSYDAHITDDGRYVVFYGDQSDLVDNDWNWDWDIFVRDLQTNTTELISVDASGTMAGNATSADAYISNDGRYVAFSSYADDLQWDVTDGSWTGDIFVRDRQTDTTELVTVDSAGTSADGETARMAFSNDGRYLAYESTNSGVTTIPDTNGVKDVFLRDLQTDTTTLLSTAAIVGSATGNGASSRITISDDGTTIGFESLASNLTNVTDTNGVSDVFVYEIGVGLTAASVIPDGSAMGNGASERIWISRDGSAVSFRGLATNLTGDADSNAARDGFVRDLGSDETFLMGRISTSGGGATGNGATEDTALSGDGRVGAFSSTASNLVSGDTNGQRDVFTVTFDTVLSFQVAAANVSESAGSLTVTVTRSGSTLGAASVDYAVTGGTATASRDFGPVGGTASFAPGATTATFNIPITADALHENNETIVVGLSNPSTGTVLGSPSAMTVTILDGNGPPSASIADVTVVEGASGTTNATFTVTLSAVSGQTATVDYATASGSATSGTDFAAKTGTLSFPAGTTTATVAVSVMGDTTDETNETFTLQLTGSTNATIAVLRATGTITDDDGPNVTIGDVTVAEGHSGNTVASFPVTLSAVSPQDVVVQFASADGTATKPGDYTQVAGSLRITAGSSGGTIGVIVKGDTLFEATETFDMNLTGVSDAVLVDGKGVATVTDDDVAPAVSVGDLTVKEGSGAAKAAFTVKLSTASGQPVELSYTTADGSALAGRDYTAASGTLVFAAGATTATIEVPLIGNGVRDDDKVFYLRLGTPTGGTLAVSQGTATILDDDETPSLSVEDVTVTEARKDRVDASFTVNLSRTSGREVTVGFTTVDQTATAGDDFSQSNGTLTFRAGTSSVTVAVAVLPDEAIEMDETFALQLVDPWNATVLDATARATVIDAAQRTGNAGATAEDASTNDDGGTSDSVIDGDQGDEEFFDLPLAPGDDILSTESLKTLARESQKIASVPAGVVLLAIGFLFVQNKMDARDPKLAATPTAYDDFEQFMPLSAYGPSSTRSSARLRRSIGES